MQCCFFAVYIQPRLEEEEKTKSAVERRLGRAENGAHKNQQQQQQQQNVEKFMYVLLPAFIVIRQCFVLIFLFLFDASIL